MLTCESSPHFALFVLIAERQAGKLWISVFIVLGLIRTGIEPESIVSVADALSTWLLIGLFGAKKIKKIHPDKHVGDYILIKE